MRDVDWLDFLAGAAHVVVAAVWLGAMAYSLAIVQPRAARFLADERRTEELAAVLAAGARRKVLAVIAFIALSGVALVLIAPAGERSGAWWALIAVKAGLLGVALGVFAHVSWRLWPARLFAGPDEPRRCGRGSAWRRSR
jgi:putative copper export protein